MKASTFKSFASVAVAMVLLTTQVSNAQFAESISKKCKGLEYEKRTRVAVGSFDVKTNAAYGQFAGELASMLSNALVSTECFQVLASTKSNAMRDMQSEKEFNRSGDVREDASVEEGQMMGAQLLVIGEVTEFSEGENGVKLPLVSVTTKKARVGFIIQIANPKTRQIIFSESINAQASAMGGFSGVNILGMPAIGSFKTKAMADAVEKAIIKAVELIVAQKEKIQAMPQGGLAAQNTEKKSVIKVESIDFVKLGALTNVVKGYLKVKEATKTLKDGVGTITIFHEGSFDELTEFISSKVSLYDIIGADSGQITLKAK
jgi:curli biogenesis system outer membrane secretion channel CsgG